MTFAINMSDGDVAAKIITEIMKENMLNLMKEKSNHEDIEIFSMPDKNSGRVEKEFVTKY